MRKRSVKANSKDLDRVIREQSRGELAPDTVNIFGAGGIPMQSNLSLASSDNKNLQLNFDKLNQDLIDQIKSDPTCGGGYQPGFLKKKHSITQMDNNSFLLNKLDSMRDPLFGSNPSFKLVDGY